MSTELLIAFNVVGIVASLTVIANGARAGSFVESLFGYALLALNTFFLLGNLA